MRRPEPQVTLYSRPGCHLCEAAIATLAQLRGRYRHTLSIVDITTDPALLQRYGVHIPVLLVDGREYRAPLLQETVRRALAGRPADGGAAG